MSRRRRRLHQHDGNDDRQRRAGVEVERTRDADPNDEQTRKRRAENRRRVECDRVEADRVADVTAVDEQRYPALAGRRVEGVRRRVDGGDDDETGKVEDVRAREQREQRVPPAPS